MQTYGTIYIKFAELFDAANFSKNKFCQAAQMEAAQFNNYYNDSITRLDKDVLARICTVFHCSIADLLEFIPPQAGQENNNQP